MNDFFVSPRFRASDLAGASLERKIAIFESQVDGWLLSHARFLASSANPQGQHAGFAILTLCLVYVESIACFLKGETSDGKARKFFDFGMTSIFTDLKPEVLQAFSNEFYRQVRCGLLHQGLTRGKVAITKGAVVALAITTIPAGAAESLQQVIIDPWLFLAHVDAHFRQYVGRLRDPGEAALRSAFEKWFEARAA
jgi:hypothetical protein